MIQDQMNNNKNLFNLRSKCYACNQSDHSLFQCNKVLFCPDKEKIIKKNEFSHPQERKPFTRKRKNKIKRGIFKPIPTLDKSISDCKIKTYDYDEEENSSVDISNEEEKEKSEENEEEGNKGEEINTNPSSNEKLLSKEFPSKQTFSSQSSKIQNPSRFSIKGEKNSLFLDPSTLPKPRISINNNEEISNNILKFKESPMSSPKNILINASLTREITKEEREFADNNSEPSLRIKKRKKEIEEEEHESHIHGSLGLIDGFDKMHEFKKYFPHNNFSYVQKNYNEKHAHLFSNKKKINELKKYFQYTFNPLLMYQKIKKQKEMMRMSKKKPYLAHCSREKSKTFIDLFSNLMKTTRDKKSKRKWYNPILKLFKKIK